MSALWKSELDSLMRLVARSDRDYDNDERDRIRAERAASMEADRQTVIDILRGAERHMTSAEVAARTTGFSRQRTDRILMNLFDQKLVSRRRRATRRPDGEGFRNPYKYSLVK